jgi:hypothetical protein
MKAEYLKTNNEPLTLFLKEEYDYSILGIE